MHAPATDFANIAICVFPKFESDLDAGAANNGFVPHRRPWHSDEQAQNVQRSCRDG